MSFGQAVSSVFSKYATFSGRARRSEYWYWVLFVFLVTLLAVVLDSVLKITIVEGSPYGWISVVVSLALLIPGIAVTVRRLHDTDRSGWWYLLSFLCGVGAIIVLVFCLIDGTPGPNKYGDSPK
jgi:uncharacterized membrane protein YhaH (DUF805 family)